ncbi:MAG: deoxyribose-phosphate aldolase [Erysipelothrix sp.]|nr:deoxyribose-phosphate aldolase [Erysipelothrix sp.]
MNKYIDHTLLKPEATEAEISVLCKEAIDYDFKAVCVNPAWITFCKNQLKASDVLVCTVVGFPLGANTTETKVFETKDAILKGADEIDMVINIGKLKDQDYDYVLNDIKAVRAASKDKTLKVIIETALLSDAEIRKVSKLCVEAKADFVKTSTGFSTSGANIRVVEIIKKTVGDDALIKAAGGVRSQADLKAMIAAGANRIGTSSGTKLIEK